MNIKTAQRLREYRVKAGYSIKDLSEKINVPCEEIESWEEGRKSPDTDYLIALARLYGVTLDSLIFEEKIDDDTIIPEVLTKEECEKETKNKKEKIKREKNKTSVSKFAVITHIVETFTPLLLLGAYLICGFCISTPLGVNGINGWAAFYPLFILIPVPGGLLKAISRKKYNEFPIIFAVTSAYCFIGMFTGLWHPFWALFFIVPVYHILAYQLDIKLASK